MINSTQTWLISGASSGIGKSMLEEAQQRGYKVAGLARSFNGVTRDDNDKNILKLRCDIRNLEQVKKCVSETVKQFNTIDVAFVNAGISQNAIFEDTTNEMITNVLETNLYGNINVLRELIPVFRKQGYGKIIINTSQSGLTSRPLGTSYCISKHGLEALAGVLRIEYGSFCQVMGLEMGWFPDTNIIKSALNMYPKQKNDFRADDFSEIYKNYKNNLDVAIKYIVDEIEKPVLPEHFILGSDAVAKVKDKIRKLSNNLNTCQQKAYNCTFPVDRNIYKVKIPFMRKKFCVGKVCYSMFNISVFALRPYNYIKFQKYIRNIKSWLK